MGLITSQLTISNSISSSQFNIGNLPSASSLTNILVYNSASGAISYTSSAAVGGGGSGTPGGSNTQVQYNAGGTFAGTASFAFIYQSRSLQQGELVTASGLFSHAEGSNTKAIGEYSHAEGGSTQAIGNYSHAEGTSTIAVGDNSHAEGSATRTGTQNAYYAEPIASGVITLSSSYSDISSEFTSDGLLYLYDRLFDNNYNRATFTISQSYFSSSNTIVELYDTSVSTTTAYVGNSTYGISNWTGDQTIPGNYSHTEGSSTKAIGQYSHAEGASTQAIGLYSHAEGEAGQAIGGASHAEGYQTIALGQYSHAEGYLTIASGSYSHAEGRITTASGDYSHAEGYRSIASGSYSHAEGYRSIASGSYSHAEGGRQSVDRAGGAALGEGSHAEGNQTLAIGDTSHSEGSATEAIGFASHAEGAVTKAIGLYSHAEGSGTQAIGSGSHAGGDSTIASGSYQTVVGSYNTQNNTGSKFIVGIGNASTRKDGFTVDADANLSGSIMIPTNTGNPSSPKAGSMYYNTSTNFLHIYNGTAWRSSSFS